MPSLTIYKGQSIHFWIRNGSGTINDGLGIEDNYEYIEGTFCGESYPEWVQLYDCNEDSVTIQIRWDNTKDLVYHLVDQSDDSIVAFGVPTLISGTTDYYEFTIDWSSYDCDTCFRIQLITIDPGGSIWGCGTSGTFEGAIGTWAVSTGLGNTIATTATAKTGVQAAQIQSGGVPAASQQEILYCTTDFTLSANTYYNLEGYIYDESANPFTQNGAEVYWSIAAGLGDATVISETRVTPSTDGRDTWLKITMTFRTGSVTTGSLRIITDLTPQANGNINIDDLRLNTTALIEEAISNQILTDDIVNDSCIRLIEYSNDENGELEYVTSGMVNRFRQRAIVSKARWTEREYTTSRNSEGTTIVVSSDVEKVLTVGIDTSPGFMHEKWARASKSDNFQIDKVYFLAIDSDYQPNWEEKVQIATGDLEITPRDYRMTNRNC